jgi:integrase
MLGAVRLSQLSTAQIQNLVSKLTERDLSPRTVKYVYDVLNMALGFAVKSGELVRNPCALVELPRQRRSAAKSLTIEEARRFIAAAESDRYAALWLLLLQTGMRPSEALGLKWEDIDSNGFLRIQRTLSRLDGAGWSFNDTKTDMSRRAVKLGVTLRAALQRHRARQSAEKLEQGPAYVDHGLVFASRNGAPLDYRAVVRRHFKALMKRAAINSIRPYDLRHSSATLDLLSGAHVKVVSERLGHANIKMTLQTYQHVLPDMQESAADAFDKLLHARESLAEQA